MLMEEKLGTMWMKGMEDVPLVKKKRILFSAGFSNMILDHSECVIFGIFHLHWREQVNAPIDARDIDLVQQTFARVAMMGSNAIGRLLFMNIFKRLGDQSRHFQRENPTNFQGSPKLEHCSSVINHGKIQQ